MIVVVGSPSLQPGSTEHPATATGLAAGIALSSAAAGQQVQLVGRVGEDPAGEATLLALARDGVSHVATLRDPAHPTPILLPSGEADPDLATGDEVLETPESGSATGTAPGAASVASLDRGDVELALRYLGTFAVVVVAEPLDAGAMAVVADAVAYNGATLVVIVAPGDPAATVPADAIALEAPADDLDGVFARTVGAFAAELDRGVDPAAALAAVVAAEGWKRSGDAPVADLS